ncbi:hypothetical protein [Thermaurantiacus tibetensis]|uniref:hypothetical protein n=1 Tax=Thermaurantiacus tibetensis TaxID=2759035 RepID=UPI00189076AD|nr:hypothetical protein [Thermaurantiacus tibetensis]
MPLTEDRNTPRREGVELSIPMAANTTIFGGALVMLNASGLATRGAVATGQRAVGVALERKTNGAVAGAERIRVAPGIYRFRNGTGADEIVQADVGAPCFILDDDQVAKTNGGGTRSAAGTVIAVEPAGVWVRIGF